MDAGTRDYSIDLVKTVAITGVVVIHACAPGFGTVRTGSFEWGSTLLWGSLARASVPLFLMCSGALLLDPERPLTFRKLYTRTLPRVLLALFFWAAAYRLPELLCEGFSVGSVVRVLKDLLAFRHEPHLYYLHITLLLYAFLPLTRVFVRHATEKELRYALGLWFVVGILYPTVRPFWPFTLLDGIPAQWMMNMAYASIGYSMLGYALRKSPPCVWISRLLFLCGFLGVFAGTWILSVRVGIYNEHFLEGMTVGVCAMATGIFGRCTALKKTPSRNTRAVVAYLSKASFCVYLTHVFFLRLLMRLSFLTSPPYALTIPFLSVLTLLCGIAAYTILSRIPWVRRWLI